MADKTIQVFYPAGYQELFGLWDNFPGAVPFAGGTALIHKQGRQILDLPPVILSLDKMEEMGRINRSERFLEIGAMVKLSQIIDLGKVVPAVLRRCLRNISGQQLRNTATIGGNVCFSERCLDSTAAFIALDAQYELRTAQSSRWISASRFSSIMPGKNAMNSQELMTRIRVPLDNWDYSSYKKFAGQASRSRSAVFLVKTQKNILNDIRIIYKDDSILRDRDGESILVGKHLPLSRRLASDFAGYWDSFISSIASIDELSRKELANFVEMNVFNLAD